MIAPIKKLLLPCLKFGLPIGILWFLVSRITDEQWETLRSSQPNFLCLGLALVIGLVATLLTFYRWGMLVRSHNIDISNLDSIRLGAIGYLLNFVSAGAVGGDVFKAYFLSRRTAGKKIEAFASALVDRIVGLYGLLVVSAVALIYAGGLFQGAEWTVTRWCIYGSTVIGAVVMLGIVFGDKVIDSVLSRLAKLPVVGGFVYRVADPLRAFRHHTDVFLAAIGISVVCHCLLALAIYFVAAGIYGTSPSVSEHFVIVPLANAISALPISPGGIGVFEGALDQLYLTLPNKSEEVSGTVVGLVFEIVKITIAAIGILFYWTGNNEMRESLKAASQEEQDATEGDCEKSADAETADDVTVGGSVTCKSQ